MVHCKKAIYDVYVGRPSHFGNPFSHKKGTLAQFHVASVEDAVREYENWVRNQPSLVAKIKRELKDKTLGCWCKHSGDEPCHGDVLVKIANEE